MNSKSSYGVCPRASLPVTSLQPSKRVRTLKGKVYDIAVDLRKNSVTFGEWVGVELSEKDRILQELKKARINFSSLYVMCLGRKISNIFLK
jgi:hypothetical protein